jgi:hypothetical protein
MILDEIHELTPAQVQQINAENPEPDEQTLELGRAIWREALKGRNRDQICIELGIAGPALDLTFQEFSKRLGTSVDRYRLIDNERIERMITFWMPVATQKMKVMKLKGENVFIGEDVDRPMKAAYFVLQAMESRRKILGASATAAGRSEAQDPAAGGLEGTKAYSERNIQIWIQNVMPSIDRAVREMQTEVVTQ